MARVAFLLELWIVTMILSLLVTAAVLHSADWLPLTIGYSGGITLGVLLGRVAGVP